MGSRGTRMKKDGGCLPYISGVKTEYLLGCSACKGPQWKLLQYLLWYWDEKIWQEMMSHLDLVPLRVETTPTRLVLPLPPASLSIKMWQQKSTEGYEQSILQHGRIKVSFCHFIDKRWEMARTHLYEKLSSTSPW